MCRCRTSLRTRYGGIYGAMPCPRTAYCSRRRQASRLTLRRSTVSCISTRGVQVCRPVGCTYSLADPFRVCLTALRACAPTCVLLKQRGGTVIFCAAETRCRRQKMSPGRRERKGRQKAKEKGNRIYRFPFRGSAPMVELSLRTGRANNIHSHIAHPIFFRASIFPVCIYCIRSEISCSGKSHQRIDIRAAIVSSEKRLRISLAGTPPTME